jgi:hypothetical protein
MGCHEPCHGIGSPARAVRHNNSNGFDGIVLRLCVDTKEQRDEQSENYFHDAGFRVVAEDLVMLPTKRFFKIRVSIGTFEKLEGILVSVIDKAPVWFRLVFLMKF